MPVSASANQRAPARILAQFLSCPLNGFVFGKSRLVGKQPEQMTRPSIAKGVMAPDIGERFPGKTKLH